MANVTYRLLSSEDIERLSHAYLTDDLNQEDLQDLRRHLSTDNWRKLQEQRMAEQTKQSGEVIPIGAGRSEAQVAQELRADLQARLETIGEIMTKARREHGLIVAFQFSLPDAFGRQSLAVLEITKKLC